MVLGVAGEAAQHRTFLPNVFIVGDTVSAAPTVASVIEKAFVVAAEIK
jgi:hypothetical protein